jgi:hypothetical protein
VWTSGILLVGIAGCAGLRREPPPMIGPGVVPAPVATSAQPVQETGVTPFAEPGGGIGRFVPGRYQQIKPEQKTASRWVDPFVQRRKSQPDRAELAGIFPQRQPIGSGRRATVRPLQNETIETLPVALNIPVYPDDDPVETAQAPRSTRRLSARIEPEVRPSRWRVPQPEPESPEQDTPPQPLPPQARRRSRPPMPQVPREQLAFGLLDAVSKPDPQPEPEVESPALIDPPVEAVSATGKVDEGGLLMIPEIAQTETTEEVPSPEPLAESEPSEPTPQPLTNKPDPVPTAEAEPAKTEESPAPVAETPQETSPPPAIDSEPEPTIETAPNTEPVPNTETSPTTEATPIVEAEPHPAAEPEPPPLVPGSEPEPNAEEADDPIFAAPPPLSRTAPRTDARSALPSPPVPPPNMVAASPAPTSDPATKRIATEVADTAPGKSKPKPARRTLWSRFVGEQPKPDTVAEAQPRPTVYATPGTGLASMPPALFLPSYYGQGTAAKRDDGAQKVSTEPSDKPKKSTDAKPRRFRLFHRLLGE